MLDIKKTTVVLEIDLTSGGRVISPFLFSLQIQKWDEQREEGTFPGKI